jgi:hypothetical protein
VKLTATHEEVSFVGDFESIEFTINFDAKMAELLSSALYQNKIAAIIRELSCNAFDSHVEAKQKRPFDVILPTYLNHTFVIRDYGTGLTPEKIKDVYTCYGTSDKLNSNKVVGCMGLGSKTPACYNTKTAIVDSYVDGKHWSYQFYIGEKGIPCLTKLAEEDTIEPNGVKISIPVLSSDTWAFARQAQEIFQWFTQKPNCDGIVYKQTEKLLDYDIHNKCSILMGNVLYPIDVNAVPKHLLCIYDTSVVIPVKIGEVDPSISREGLQYTDKTKKTISHYLTKIHTEIVKTGLLDNCKTLHAARLKLLRSNIPEKFYPLYLWGDKPFSLAWSCGGIWTYSAKDVEFTQVKCKHTIKDLPIYINDSVASRKRIISNKINCYYFDKNVDIDKLGLVNEDVIGTSTLPYVKPKPLPKITSKYGYECVRTGKKSHIRTELPNTEYYYYDFENSKYIVDQIYKALICINPKYRLFQSNKHIAEDKNAVSYETVIQKYRDKNKNKIIAKWLEDYPVLTSLIRNYYNIPKILQQEIQPYKDIVLSDTVPYEIWTQIKYNNYNDSRLNDLNVLKNKIYKMYPLLEYVESSFNEAALFSYVK